MTRGRALDSMSMIDIEQGGMRFWERKGMINGEQADGWDEDWDESFADEEPPAERITERDIDVEAEEALRHEEEMILVEMIFVDPMER